MLVVAIYMKPVSALIGYGIGTRAHWFFANSTQWIVATVVKKHKHRFLDVVVLAGVVELDALQKLLHPPTVEAGGC